MIRDRLGTIRKLASPWIAAIRGLARRRPTPTAASTLPSSTDWPAEPAEDRLVRLAAMCVEGQLAAAEMDLHAWRREPDCPPAARFLLAGLLARRRADDDAIELLRQATHAPADQSSDTDTLRLAIVLLVDAEMPESAGRALLRLFHDHGDDPSVAAWVRALEFPGTADLPAVPDAQIERLAGELLADPTLIPTLVATQKIRPVTSDLTLLRQGIARMLQAAGENAAATLDLAIIHQALAELALLAHDADDARRWAHRGLRINPFSAALALVVAQLADDETLGPTAQRVLTGAIAANPRYPDLRAALIRRQQREGRTQDARLFLEDWLASQPGHPLALQIKREIAA